MKRTLLAIIAAVSMAFVAGNLPVAHAAFYDQCYNTGASAVPSVVAAGASVAISGEGTCPHQVTHTQIINGVPFTYTTTEQAAQFRLRLQQGFGPVFTFADFQPGNFFDGTVRRWTVPTSPLDHGTVWTAYVDVCAYVAPAGCVGPISTATTSFTVR